VSFLTLNEKRAAVGVGAEHRFAMTRRWTRPRRPPRRKPSGRPLSESNTAPTRPALPPARPTAGQWVDEGGGVSGGVDASARSDRSRNENVRVAQADESRYRANLDEEEAKGGHTLRFHIAKSDKP